MSISNIPEVFDFSSENLAEKICSFNNFFSEKKLSQDDTFKYLCYYFSYEQLDEDDQIIGHCKANTCVLEQYYISETYLKDYSHYYSTCFRELPKFSMRLHFFNESFDADDFTKDAILEHDIEKHEKIWSSYLGCVTIRPVGLSPFGVCLFATYPLTFSPTQPKKSRLRYFNSIIKDFRFDVFGKQIKMDTLAFQQQDEVVGACATFAIWSAFHKLNRLYKVKVPSPYEITERAGISISESSRVFPAGGLDGYQIISVLEKSKITAETFDFKRESVSKADFQEIVYAYNKCGIPILLGYQFEDSDQTTSLHLVSIVGYRLTPDDQSKPKVSRLKTVAHRMMRFYTHNDLLGPYSKVDFHDSLNGKDSLELKTFQLGTNTPTDANALAVWIPIDPIIKVKYEEIVNAVIGFDSLISQEIYNFEKYTWDIYLSRSVDYKQEFSETKNDFPQFNETKLKIRYTSYPKYIWVSRLIDTDGYAFIDIVYDASALPNDNCLLQINFMDQVIKSIVDEVSTELDKDDNINLKPYDDFYTGRENKIPVSNAKA